MERLNRLHLNRLNLKNLNLKQALFALLLASLLAAALLSALTVLLLTEWQSQFRGAGVDIVITDGGAVVMQRIEPAGTESALLPLLLVLQIALPVVFFMAALLVAIALFYRLKLQKPLAILADGANRIIANDLDFTVEAPSNDEMGRLCAAFETMRRTLLENNRELWRQAEERRRLNAAFSHDLRNPVTVLKGSAKLAKQCAANGDADSAPLLEHLERIEVYAERVGQYVEAMSSVGRLEQLPVRRRPVEWRTLARTLEETVRLVAADGDKTVVFDDRLPADGVASVDQNALAQIAENLVANALRFAAREVRVSLSASDGLLALTVADDGAGFPAAILQNGPQPFQKGAEQAEHFGMGLYICALLCRKHGGFLTLWNGTAHDGGTGANARAQLRIV